MSNFGGSSSGSGLQNTNTIKDYGSISNTAGSSNFNNLPDVNFSEFSPTEYISLRDNVASAIQVVSSSKYSLEKMLKNIGTQKDNQRTRDKIHQIQTTTNIKIKQSSKDLQRLTNIVRGRDKLQRLHVEKLTNDFEIGVKGYTDIQEAIVNKMKRTLPSNLLLQQENENEQLQNEDDRLKLIQEQKRLERDAKHEESLLRERQNQMRQIESDIIDVNDIMRELKNLVSIQGETVVNIENQIENTNADIKSGTEQLQQAAVQNMKYRKKVILLLIIAVIVGIIITCIIVSSFKR